MVFNEIPAAGLRRAAAECHRILVQGRRLLATVLHPDFVHDLKQHGDLKVSGKGLVTMPGPEELRLPVYVRSVDEYQIILSSAGFRLIRQDVKGRRKVPVAMILDCLKDGRKP